ncbi:MAG: hypothetical protein JWN63_1222 [Candidatus Acidoferrum typicum]|nr:hypothetical protein [Candidatus Acidoferrum typicum]
MCVRTSRKCAFQRKSLEVLVSRSGQAVRLSTYNVLAQCGVGCMHDVRTGRDKQKLVRLISIRSRFEVPVGANIHCGVYVTSLTSNSLCVNAQIPFSIWETASSCVSVQ